MAGRWVLERAGITNVYQYGDETLHFGGGRLLLRGVNGSGKSTAMNMLLPFLLDADTRRIDAAGEQSGVLRSWMLSGRDEPQPQGYLWVEFGRVADHLTFGCGIRANQSTERVTTWWFVTARRPGIDLALVEGRQPLSADSLRATLEPGAVYRDDQRTTYRSEVRARLYGGADLDQHLRLLHVVRNPRVGDRIDVDVAQYLHDALPQLSDDALEDAAQPLEDLEEHRRNVDDLDRTATALGAIQTVYQAYARTELRRTATSALALVDEQARLDRAERRSHAASDQAAVALDRAAADRRTGAALAERLGDEIRSLEASDAYKAGAELNDLREHVQTLAGQVSTAREDAERGAVRTDRAADTVATARAGAQGEAARLATLLGDLAAASASVGLTERPPDAPAVDHRPIRPDGPAVPLRVIDEEPIRARVGGLRAARNHRGGDVRSVREALAAVDQAEVDLRRAEGRRTDAADDEERTRSMFVAAREAAQCAVDEWQQALGSWSAQLADHRARHHMDERTFSLAADHEADLVGSHHLIADGWRHIADQTADEHRRAHAGLDARRSAHQEVLDDLADHLAELQGQVLPEPPTAAWQKRTGVPCLAELVDFAPHLPADERAGLEAAMEAAGLLSAEVAADGRLVLADGQLVAGGDAPATAGALDGLLSVTIPPEWSSKIDAKAVLQVLEAISAAENRGDSGIDPAAGAPTMVTTDGRFRVGLLHGRHHKAEAEHIGLAARRASLHRQRAEAADAVRQAEAVREEMARLLAEVVGRIDEATGLQRALPSSRVLVAAAARSEHAEVELAQARIRLDARRAAYVEAEGAHATRVEDAERLASSFGLPLDRVGLDGVDVTLTAIGTGCDLTDAAATSLAASVTRWIDAGTAWVAAADDQGQSDENLDRVRHRHGRQAARLATLEDSIGADYDAVVGAIAEGRSNLALAEADFEAAQRREVDASGHAATAAEQHRRAAEEAAEQQRFLT